MNILILGATGFIGNAIFNAINREHDIIIAGRNPIDGFEKFILVDFTTKQNWKKLVDGFDLVINAVGIIKGDFEQIQTNAPLALYKACINKQIKSIHISAIGAEKEKPSTSFLLTKKITDQFLLQNKFSKVVYPGIVIGNNGESSKFFAEMADFPIVPILADKHLPLVHINQLTGLIKNIVDDYNAFPQQIFAVSKPETLSQILSAIKGKKITTIKIPQFFFKVFFTLFPKASIGIFNKNMFRLFIESSTDDYQAMFDETSKHIKSKSIRKSDELSQLFALLAISFIWLWSGVSSLIAWNDSCSLMKEAGFNDQLSPLFIYLGSFTDIILGLAIFSPKYRKNIIILQVLMMLVYMAILTIGAPHYWLHPFGVLSKNIPIFALSYYLYQKQK